MEEEKVAARLMGLWMEDPFNIRVNLDRPQTCPFNRDNRSCNLAKVRGKYTSTPISLPCPSRDKEDRIIETPEQCPLRYDKITVEEGERG